MSLKSWFKAKVTGIEGSGSAFARVAVHKAEELEIQGKVVALELAEDAASKFLAEAEKVADRIHARRDAIDARRKNLASRL